jgi:ABC-2 type transport system permease protein
MISYPAFVAALACAHLLGTEYASGAIATTFVLVPRRERVLAAKALAGAALGALTGLACAAAMLVTAALWLPAWTVSTRATSETALGIVAVCVTFCVAGVAAGALVRRPGSAGGVLSVIYLGLSGLLGATTLLPAWTDYGIGAAQIAATAPAATHAFGYAGALAANAGYCLAFLAAGIAVARRADV